MEIKVMEQVMKSNEETAADIRAQYDAAKTLALNLLGSPGAGKTTLLERTLEKLKDKLKVAVIEGDLYTSKDADRIEKSGAQVVQINTAGGCHLDSKMIAKVIPQFDLDKVDLMIVENVGNLVCPAAYDLGEHDKVVVLSITEGGDKPLKYPRIFLESTATVLNKTDLLPFCDVDMELMKKDILSINPKIIIFETDCRSGQGMESWVDWLVERVSTHGKNSTITG